MNLKHFNQPTNYMVNLVSMRMHNHAGPSGYDRLADYVDANVFTPPQQWTMSKRIAARLLKWLIHRSGSTLYHRESLYNEMVVAKLWLWKRRQLFHFIYGENSFRYLGSIKKSNPSNRIIVTYHTPPNKFESIVKARRHIQSADAIIVVSSIQKDFFEKLVGPDRVFYIPHGIDINYYSPAKTNFNKDIVCLFVGSHLRDYKTLSNSIQKIAKVDQTIRFIGVISPENYQFFQHLPNVSLFSGLSDFELRELYRNSTLLVLPLLDSTANNSILEAMACGLPVVSTDLPGVKDYVSPDCATLCAQGDAPAIVDAILQFKSSPEKREKFSKNCRKHALLFSWENIADQIRTVYRKTAEGSNRIRRS